MDEAIARLERWLEGQEDTMHAADVRAIVAEVRRLQTILDNRPAINAGLPETYIEWSQGIYMTDMAHGAQLYQS
jgi:hypothetical protein